MKTLYRRCEKRGKHKQIMGLLEGYLELSDVIRKGRDLIVTQSL